MHSRTNMESRIDGAYETMRQIPKLDDNLKQKKTLWNTVDVNVVFAVFKKKEKTYGGVQGKSSTVKLNVSRYIRTSGQLKSIQEYTTTAYKLSGSTNNA